MMIRMKRLPTESTMAMSTPLQPNLGTPRVITGFFYSTGKYDDTLGTIVFDKVSGFWIVHSVYVLKVQLCKMPDF